jgi:exonuclease VII large subunit
VRIDQGEQALSFVFPKLEERFMRAEEGLIRAFERISFILRDMEVRLAEIPERIFGGYRRICVVFSQALLGVEEKLREYDPERALALGYGLIRSQGKLVQSIAEVKTGSRIAVQIRDGTLEA